MTDIITKLIGTSGTFINIVSIKATKRKCFKSLRDCYQTEKHMIYYNRPRPFLQKQATIKPNSVL